VLIIALDISAETTGAQDYSTTVSSRKYAFDEKSGVEETVFNETTYSLHHG